MISEDRAFRTAPRVPAGELVYAIGDIHGELYLLDKLLGRIVEDAAFTSARRRSLIFVGDYIDRGPDSAGVVDRLVSGLPEGFDPVFLKGNHEAFLLEFLEHPEVLDAWLHNGAVQTLASYGIDPPTADWPRADYAGCRDAFLAALPESHRAFFGTLQLWESRGDYLFVHAGVRPGVPLESQSERDLLWIRDDFLASRRHFGKVVVHGHTPGREPVVRPNRIGIDTGAFVHGRLTALRLFGDQQSFVTAEPGLE